MGLENRKKLLNDELVLFIVSVLLICDKVREASKGKAEKRIEIRAINAAKSIIYTGKEHNFAETLLNYVFLQARNSEDTFTVRDLYMSDISEHIVRLPENLTDLNFYSLEDSVDMDKIAASVDRLFIDNEVKEEFDRHLKELDRIIAEFDVDAPFVCRQQISEYLRSYLQILVFLLRHEELIEDRTGRKEILKPLLNFCDFDKFSDEEETSVRMSFFSPVSMYLFWQIYYRIEEYIEMEVCDDSEDLELICREIFEKKVRHSFRWFLADENQKLYHAAISPFVEKRAADHQLMIPVHRLERYNSFEGVRELRLAEKILFELEDWEKLDSCSDGELIYYKVAVLGDLQKQPVEELGEYLTKLLKHKIGVSESSGVRQANLKIYLEVYTKTDYRYLQDCSGDKEMYAYEFKWLDGILKDKMQLDAVFDAHDLVLILDSIDLYNDIYVEEYYNPEFYKQRLKYPDYSSLEREVHRKRDIGFDGFFRELHGTMTAYLYSGKWGNLKKTADSKLLKYLESRVAISEQKKAVYVYVSDLNAFQDLYCNDRYFVRKEQYSDKEIGIIRYSKRCENALKLAGNSHHIIVFNVWQFVKHIVIDNRNYFLEKLLPGISGCTDLKQIYIGIQYSHWRRKIVLDYYLEGHAAMSLEAELAVKGFIQKTLIPVLNLDCDFMYREYIHKAVSSFLYSDVADVEDMLFVHLFKNHHDLLGKVVMASEHRAELVHQNINRSFKYSFKRFYDMTMESYDISATEYLGQYQAVDMIVKCLDLRRAWERDDSEIVYTDEEAKKKIFEQIMKACEELQYTDSYLYIQCRNELSRN